MARSFRYHRDLLRTAVAQAAVPFTIPVLPATLSRYGSFNNKR
jgi:hypothetical protein